MKLKKKIYFKKKKKTLFGRNGIRTLWVDFQNGLRF
jgi:hypothetical protein